MIGKLGIIGLIVATFAVSCVGAERLAAQAQSVHVANEITTIVPEFASNSSVAIGKRGVLLLAGRKGIGTYVARSTDYGRTFSPPHEFPLFDDPFANEVSQDIVATRHGNAAVSRIIGRTLPQGLFVSVSNDSGQTWRPTQELSIKPYRPVVASKMAWDGDRLYVFWIESFAPDPGSAVLFRRSLDGGQTFEAPVEITSVTDGRFLEIADLEIPGLGGFVYALIGVTEVSLEESLFLYRSTNGGTTWDSPVDLAPSEPYFGCPRIESTPSGLVYAAWISSRLFPDISICFARSVDSGQTFGSCQRIDDPGNGRDEEFFSLASNANRSVYVVWEGDDSIDDLRINVSDDGGQTFRGETVIPSSHVLTSTQLAPGLAVNESGDLAVLSTVLVGGEERLEFNWSRDDGLSWLANPILVDEGGSPAEVHFFPQVRVDEAGRIFMAWDYQQKSRFRSAHPTLGISALPRDDGDGVLVVPPGGERIAIDIELRNHHPSDPLTGLTGFLEVILPSGQRIGPIGMPRNFGISTDGSRSATFRANFPGAKPPGLYSVLVTTQGSIEDSIWMPILKQ